ncbi:MAG: hypothetical protein U0T82_11575 [Bacteroidales bacterium]
MNLYFSSTGLIFSIVFISFFSPASAQGPLRPGSVILKNGDSIQGLCDSREWKANPYGVDLWKTSQSKKLVFTPQNVKSYQVDGDIYISACVKSRVNAMESSLLLPDPEPRLMEDTVFLQVLVEGPRSLYYYRNKAGNDNFYFKNDSSYDLLVFNRYVSASNPVKVVTMNNKYMGQLKYYLRDCSGLIVDPGKLKYQSVNILKIYQAYYDCTSQSPSYIVPINKPKIEFSIIIWAASSGYEVAYSYTGRAMEYRTHKYRQIVPSIGVEVIFPKRGYHWSLNNELSFYNVKTEGTSRFYTDEANNTLLTVQAGFKSLNINTMARYRIPYTNGSFYLNGGIVYGLVWDEIRKTHELTYLGGELNERSITYPKPLYASVLGLSAGSGVRWKNISLEYRYIIGITRSNMIGIGYHI